jgi:hypothetical protein
MNSEGSELEPAVDSLSPPKNSKGQIYWAYMTHNLGNMQKHSVGVNSEEEGATI